MALLRDAQFRVSQTQRAIDATLASNSHPPYGNASAIRGSKRFSPEIHDALRQISDTLANSYIQILRDIEDRTRTSWAGTAHEIREIVANMLRLMAPDTE